MGKLWGKIGDKFQDLIDNIKTKHPKLGKILQPVKCRLFGEPVDAVTGRVYSTNRDIELPGPIPFVWERTYYSDAEVDGPLGYNWHHNYNMGLYDMGDGFATVRLWDGRETILPLLSEGERFVSRKEGLAFTRDAEGFLLTDKDKRLYRFNAPKNGEGYKMLSSIETPDGFAIRLKYAPGGILRAITDSVGRVNRGGNRWQGTRARTAYDLRREKDEPHTLYLRRRGQYGTNLRYAGSRETLPLSGPSLSTADQSDGTEFLLGVPRPRRRGKMCAYMGRWRCA